MAITDREKDNSNPVVLVGRDELLGADVKLDHGFNRLQVSSDNSFNEDVSLGAVPGYTYLGKFGHNPAVGGTFEAIWDLGGSYPFPTSAAQLLVSSSDNNDKPGDTGAYAVRIFGLDANYLEIQEDLVINGTTAVTTVNSYLRVYRAFVLTGGSSQSNEGDIDFNHNGTDIMRIRAGEGQTLMCVYTVPAGRTLLFYSYFFTLSSGKNTIIRFRARPLGGVFLTKLYFDTDVSLIRQFTFPEAVPEKTDMLIEAEASTGSHSVAAGFGARLIDNDLIGE